MRTNWRHIGLNFLVATATMLSVPSVADMAYAAEEPRRVLKARQMGSADDAGSEYARKAEEKRLESIRFLDEFLNRPTSEGGATGDQRAEMMLRLADLNFQQGRYLYLQEMAAFDKKFDACFNTEGCKTDGMQPDNSGSRKWQDKAIKLYSDILKNYPRYARADEATYYLGAALSDTGRRDEAVEQFLNLTKLYPDSQWVPDSYVSIGEYYFDTNNAFKALQAYKKATAYPQSPMYNFATYKLGWCYYNVGEYQKAIDTMKSVVKLADGSDKSKLQLQEEALKDLVRFFADGGMLDEAYEYFNALGKKNLIRDMLKRLASTYFEQGKWELCIQTYRRLIAEDPNSLDNVGYQVDIISAYKKVDPLEAAYAEVERLLKTYGKDSPWARTNSTNTEAIKTANEKIELQLRQAAIEYHTAGNKYKTGDLAKKNFAMAYKAYGVYLDHYGFEPKAYDVRYAFAELLYKLKRYDEAFEQYMAVVKMDPKGARSQFCAESAIFAADEMIKAEAKTNPAPAADPSDKSAKPLTSWEQRLVDACKQYADLYPKDEKVNKVIYRSAYLLYNKYHFPEAAEQFNAVIKRDPASKEAEQAAHLILDSFKINEDYDNLKKNAKFYFEQQGLGTKQFKTEVYAIYERASFKVIEVDFAKSNDKSKAGDDFVAFYNEFPKSEVAAQALNNASVYYHATSRIADAMKVRHILVDNADFGTKTKYYYDQISAIGYDYESIAAFDKAAAYYEQLAKLFPKKLEELKKDAADKVPTYTQNAADALYSAALFRRAAGQSEQAVTDYRQFINQFSEDARVNDIKLTIGRIFEDQKKWNEADIEYYNFYTKSPKGTSADFLFFARLRHAKMLEKMNKRDEADKVYTDSINTYKRFLKEGGQPGPYTAFIAEMMFIQAEPKFQRYLGLKIAGAGTQNRNAEDKAITASVKAKAQALIETEKMYGEIIQLGAGEWGLASLVKLGQVYENMASSLKNSTVPFYLDDDQRDMYRMQLEDKAYPQVEKAVAAYGAALGRSFELTLYNDNTAFATRRLGELRPDDFPGLSEMLLEPRYTSTIEHTYSFEKEL
jgi:tetratricopeptide (TPR) repeat protein